MDYAKHLTSGFMRLPIILDEEHFPDWVEKLLMSYLDLSTSCGFPEEKIKNMKHFNYKMVLTVRNDFQGKPALAYINFKTEIDKLSPYFQKYILPFNSIFEKDTALYRARANTSAANSEEYTSDKMFHIPFQLRGKVESQRYSISGLPVCI